MLIKLGNLFSTDIIQARDLQAHLDNAIYYQDLYRANRIQELMATEQRRYDFERPNLNAMVNIVPERFYDWLTAQWVANP